MIYGLSSTDKVITDPKEILKKGFMYFLIYNKSDSNIFNGFTMSLKDILTTFVNQTEVKKNAAERLYTLYSKHFDKVSVNAEFVQDIESSGIENLFFSVSVVTKTGTVITFNQSVKIKNNTISNLLDIEKELNEKILNN